MTETRGPSSDVLKTSIASFLQRAQDIDGHPLGHAESLVNVKMRLDLKTGEVRPVGFDMKNLPKFEVMSLATVLRPIIFLEQEPISYNVLTNRIEREHPQLRGRLRPGRERFAAWKKHVFVHAPLIGTADAPLPPEGQTGDVRGHVRRAGTISSTRQDGLSPDYDYALAYLYARAWHSDDEKARDYQAASDHMKLHYEKCAELRALSATEIVMSLRQWILDARAAGHDF